MVIAKVDIINLALSLVGAKKLIAVSDNTKAAKLAASLFKTSYRAMAELPHNWKFLTARKQLGALDDPDFGSWEHQFEISPNVLRIIAQIDVDDDSLEYSGEREVYIDSSNVEHDAWLTNQTTCYIRYIRDRGTDQAIARWPGWFSRIVALDLGILLCEPLKQDKVKKNQLLAMMASPVEGWMAKAIMANALENIVTSRSGVPLDKGNQDVINASGPIAIDRKFIQTRDIS